MTEKVLPFIDVGGAGGTRTLCLPDGNRGALPDGLQRHAVKWPDGPHCIIQSSSELGHLPLAADEYITFSPFDAHSAPMGLLLAITYNKGTKQGRRGAVHCRRIAGLYLATG